MRRTRELAVVMVALSALSACTSPATESDGAGSGAKVATLTSAAPSASAAPQRPRYRLDSTAEDEEALLAPYFKCLKEHGYSFVDAKKAGLGGGGVLEKDPKKVAEMRACEQQYFPLPAWEQDPANPEAADFAKKVNECLEKKGIKMEGDGFAGEMGSSNIVRALELTPACEREVAARK